MIPDLYNQENQEDHVIQCIFERFTIWCLDAETLGPRAPPSEHKIVNMPYWN